MLETDYNLFNDIAKNLFLYGGYFMALVVLAGVSYISVKLILKITSMHKKF